VLSESERIASAEEFFASTGADIRHGGNKAFYHPVDDYIQMPEFGAFRNPIDYYAILSHEEIHWTAHPTRCNRNLSDRFGSESYAAEELIAELGAAYLCAGLGLSNKPRKDHASYLSSWLKVLRGDKRAIFTAAAKAQEAVDWLERRY